MKSFKKFFALVIVAVIAIVCLAIPTFADSANAPYTRSWLDAISGEEHLDIYMYNQGEGGYYKTGVVLVKGNNAYYKTVDTVMTTSLKPDEIAYDTNGNIWFVTLSSELWYWPAGSKNGALVTSNVDSIELDNNDFGVGYYTTSNQYCSFPGINPSTNNNGNNGNSNDNWNNNGSNGNSNTGGNNNGGSGNNNSGNSTGNSGKYPYICQEDGKLTYVESLSEHHVLYEAEGMLVFNNLILTKSNVKDYAFYRNGVVYITSDNKLVIYQFGAKSTVVKAKKVQSLSFDDNGFCNGYVKTNGKTYNL